MKRDNLLKIKTDPENLAKGISNLITAKFEKSDDVPDLSKKGEESIEKAENVIEKDITAPKNTNTEEKTYKAGDVLEFTDMGMKKIEKESEVKNEEISDEEENKPKRERFKWIKKELMTTSTDEEKKVPATEDYIAPGRGYKNYINKKDEETIQKANKSFTNIFKQIAEKEIAIKEKNKLENELAETIKIGNKKEIKILNEKLYEKFVKKEIAEEKNQVKNEPKSIKTEEENISDQEYKDYVDNNKVSDERLKNIAKKVWAFKSLSKREQAIFSYKTLEINEIIKNIEFGYIELELDTTREMYARGYRQFLKDRKKSSSWFTNVSRKIFGSEVKEGDTPKFLKDLEKEYEKSTIEYGKKMYAEKEEELKKSKLSAEEQKVELKRYKSNEIFTKIIIEEQSLLNSLKAEKLPAKEKALWKKALDLYSKQWFDESKSKIKWKNRAAKIAVTTLLTTGIVAFVPSGASLGAGALASYAGTRLARGIAGSITGQTANKIFEYSTKAYNWLFNKKTSTEKRETEEKELSKIFAEESFDTSFVKNKKEYAEILERERKAKRERLITKSLITLAAGGLASYEMGSLAHGLSPEQANINGNLEPKTNIHTENTPVNHEQLQNQNVPKGNVANINQNENLNIKTEELKNIPKENLTEEINKVTESKGIQEFMQTNSTQDAIKLGMYNPETEAESMNVQHGTVTFVGADGHKIEVQYSSRGAIQTIDDLKKEIHDYYGDKVPSGQIETEYTDMKGVEHNQVLIKGDIAEQYKGDMFDSNKNINHTNDNIQNNQNPYAIPPQEDAVTGENIEQNHINNPSEYDLPTQETPETNIGVHDANYEKMETMNAIETPKHIENTVEIKNENELMQARPEEIARHSKNSMGSVKNMAHNYLLKNITTTELLDKALSPQQLEQVNIMHENNIEHIFPNEENNHAWYAIKDSHQLTAEKMLHTNINNTNETYKSLILHFKNLHEVTGLEPIPQTLIQIGETPNEYLLRCEKFVILNGLQNKIKL
ncbi:MAG: hypothetical protein WC264_03705 [Candidatus Paceibacterota bacterium]|jgi:hypothetical protein